MRLALRWNDSFACSDYADEIGVLRLRRRNIGGASAQDDTAKRIAVSFTNRNKRRGAFQLPFSY
jgi:hypothetical protein